MLCDTTIAAVSTPPGIGGIAIVRMSGPGAVSILQRIFKSGGGRGKEDWKGYRLYHGWITDKGEPVDEVIAAVFRGPNSYTGEDIVEVHCHGGLFVSRRILEMLIQNGAAPAKPGEFTERAFLNGRIDLTQAEAVADLIQARTAGAHRVAARQLHGDLSERLNQYRQRLIEFCALLEIELDFADEEVEFASREQLLSDIDRMEQELIRLGMSFQKGRVAREGVSVAIVGRPNVGKSTVLNRLLKKERAIVTSEPGTTRDTLEEPVEIKGALFKLTDTAGIRETDDKTEREGVQRAENALAMSDMALLVVDASETWTAEDAAVLELVLGMEKPVIVALNKRDLDQRVDIDRIGGTLPEERICRISALKNTGFNQLEALLFSLAMQGGTLDTDEVILTRLRHLHCTEAALDALRKARSSLNQGLSPEFTVIDIREAMAALETLTGKVSNDDILNHIFSEFCIGK